MKTKSIHKENSKAWWDERYTAGGPTGLYGKEPSKFLLDQLDLIPKGAKVLDVACGEGRNAVALALKGFNVTALDFSAVALERAQTVAKESNAGVTFKPVDLDMYLPELMAFGAIAIINYKPAKTFLNNVTRGLAKDGFLLMEANLMAAAQKDQSIETFECFTPNELLRAFVGPQASFRILSYSELGHDKVFLVAQKTQLF